MSLRALAVAVGVLAAGAAPAAAAPLGTITTSPKLFPKFSARVTDYVARCQSGSPLRLTVHARGSAKVRIDGGRATHGSRRVRLRLAGGQGTRVRLARGKAAATYYVRCIGSGFPRWTAERHGTPQAQWYIVTPSGGGPKNTGTHFVAIFDRNGVPVWWLKEPTSNPNDAKLLPDGNLVWSDFTFTPWVTRSAPYREHRFDGTEVRSIAAVGNVETDSHELQVLPNGDYLLEAYVPRDGVDLSPYGGPKDATVVDAEVQEVSPGGQLVWSWNSKDHLDLSESGPWMSQILPQPRALPDGRLEFDIVHINGIEPDGNSLLLSFRHTDAIYKINRATGDIEWKLGGTHTPQSLAVAGEPSDSLLFSGQHDPRLLPDGTLTVHDNRTLSLLRPRAVRFRIDEAAHTATQIEQVTDPETPHALCCGSARKLPAGDWVMDWGYSPLITELKPSGKRVFALHFGGQLYSYRAVPVLPGKLSARKLRAGMDAMHPRRR